MNSEQQWEYAEVVVDSAYGPPYPSRVKALEKMGAKGWELVDARDTTHMDWTGPEMVFGIPCTVLTFKRRGQQ